MPNEIRAKSITALTVAIASLSSLGTAGAAVQSTKLDLGATRAETMLLRAQITFASAPVAGAYVSFYAGFSADGTPGTGNPAGLSGANGAYTGYGGGAAEGVAHLTLVGVMPVAAVTSAQIKDVGMFAPTGQYVMLVAVNAATQPVAATSGLTIIPLMDELQ